MSGLISILLAFSALLLPNTLLLVVAIPALIILASYMELIAPLLSFGDKTIHVYDVVILTLSFKLFARYCLSRFPLDLQPLHRYVGLYFTVLFGATLLAYFRFGPMIFWSDMSAYLRFLMMAGTFLLLYYSVTSTEELRMADKYFRMVGLAICLSVYLSIALYQAGGIRFGEVQDTRGMVRYFGPLGDQVGYIISLFCFRELLAGRTLHAVFYGAAIFATGTRGALTTLFIGLLLAYFSRRKSVVQKPKWASVAVFVLVTVLAIGFGTMMLARFTNMELLSSGLTQRALSIGLGIKVFSANMLTGVGYSGFRFAALGYDPEALFPAFALNVITNTSNQFVQVATDAGIPGIVAFLLLMKAVYSALKTAVYHAADELQYTFAGGRIWLVALLIGNQTAVWLIQGSMTSYLFWVLLALAAVATKITGSDNAFDQVET